ncbi:ANKRD50 [Symbiodinium necroappetens]|uniref:ANKRD50 protein n=1 Tax=Symbiodinium necroappetens TaxID=1628268 RepID=A0A813AEM5_9DINO|nr:ANKRD50 [Symbiodinium necroappetens]
MLRVMPLSGEEVATIPFSELTDVKFLKQRLHLQHGLQPRFRQRLLYEGNTLDDAVRLDSITDLDSASVAFPEEPAKTKRPPASEQISVGDAALKRQLDPGGSLPAPCRQKLFHDHKNSNDPVKLDAVMELQVLILPFSGASKRQQKELYQAARSGLLDEVEALLQLPRDPDAAIDAFGRTPLMHASERGHIEVVELLLEARAQVDLCNNYGGAALTDAASYGRYRVVQLLIEAGAQKDLRNNRGRTALMDAAINGHAQVVQLLLESGADKDLYDDLGLTARMMAKAKQHDEVQRLLETDDAADRQEHVLKPCDSSVEYRGLNNWNRALGASYQYSTYSKEPYEKQCCSYSGPYIC